MLRFQALLLCSFILIACDRTQFKEETAPKTHEEERRSNFGKLFGEEFLIFGGPGGRKNIDQTPVGNVNAHLWLASLQTLSFMPFASADSQGGIIVTDWYSAPEEPNERIKVTVTIKDKSLRTDALKVVVHKQISKSSRWVPTSVDDSIAQELEKIILTKARQGRIASIATNK